MIIDEIKNSIRKALFEADNKLNFYFEEIKYTQGFPLAKLNLKNFKVIPTSVSDKQKCDFSFELVYQKSEENKMSELFEAQMMITKAVLPTVTVQNKKITLDNVIFSVSDKTLLMTFDISLYTFETETESVMETLDITVKENNNAR